MEDIDVDEIAEVNYSGDSLPSAAESVEVIFKDGTKKVFSGPALPEVLAMLNHWTPPTA